MEPSAPTPESMQAASPAPTAHRNLASIVVKDVELGAADLLKFIAKSQKVQPAALAALAVLAGSVKKALEEVAMGAADPGALLLDLPTTVADFETLWPELVSFLGTLGIKL